MYKWFIGTPLVIYIIILMMGYVVMNGWLELKTRPSWRAAKALHPNHRITEGDLKEPEGWSKCDALPPLKDQLGKYLHSAKKKDDPVKPKDLGETPTLVPGRKSSNPGDSPSWKAAKAMGVNDIIREGDLKEPRSWSECVGLPELESQLGKYVLSSKEENDLVAPKDLGISPNMHGALQVRGKPSWRATKALPVNHQIREGDLKESESWSERVGLPAMESQFGKHLLISKEENHPVEPKELSVQPAISSGDSHCGAFLYPLKDEMMYAEILDVGSWVRPCFSTEANESNKPVVTKCLDLPFAVLAVHRSTFAKDSSWIALRVPLAKAAELGEFLAANKKFLLVIIEPPPEKSICWE